MPNSSNSSQMGSLTTSSNGENVVSQLQAVSHFLLEGNSYTQTAGQAFGVISNTQFRTTAKLNTTGKIYTICPGQILVQPQTGNTSKVNIIIRPFKQPISGLSIKYIIYRGLTASAFVAGATVATQGSSGFADFVWEEFNRFYANDPSGDPVPAFSSSFIGYPDAMSTQTGSDLIDKFFFKITEVINTTTGEEDPDFIYELPLIPRGIDLGTVAGEIGIDLILNSGDYSLENDTNPFQLDLDFARATEGLIDTTTETDVFKQKLLREACTRFMDIAAFYGLHANGQGKLYYDAIDTPLTTKADIYTRMGNFATKNKVYLYVQSNRQRSYNFYDNYVLSDTDPNNLKIGVSDTSLTELTFGTSGWPIQVFTETQTLTDNGTMYLHLLTDANPESVLFVQAGFLISPHNRNFVVGDNLLEEPTGDLRVTTTDYSKQIIISFPLVGTDTISSFVQLIYEGKGVYAQEYLAAPPPPDPQLFLLKDIDDLFGPVNALATNTNANSTQLPTLIGDELQLVNFSTDGSFSTGLVSVKRIEDLLQSTDPLNSIRRVTYETLMNTIGRDASPKSNPASGFVDSTSTKMQQYSVEINNFYQPDLPYYLSRKLFTDTSLTLTGLKLLIQGNARPTKKMLGISRTEQDRLGVPVATHDLNNAKIYFFDTQRLGSSKYVSSTGVKYRKYQLWVIGENDAGELMVYAPDEEVVVYSIDDLIYCSKEYSEYLPDLNTESVESNISLIEVDLT